MCFNCGCEMPEDDMGNADNITNETFRHVAEHQDLSFEDVRQMVYHDLQKELAGENVTHDAHIVEMFEKAAQASQQNVEDAKKNTFELLKKELGES